MRSTVDISSIDSPGSRMNSQRRCPRPDATIVVGRAGSHTCTSFGRNARFSWKTTSTRSQSCLKFRSIIREPMTSRTKLLAPSQPMT